MTEPTGWSACGKTGAVAAGGPRAVDAGMQMLTAGLNAFDAAAATILALSVTDHGLFAIGGEVPFIFHDASSGRTRVLSGLGRAPLAPDAIAWYMANGIPADGNMKAAPVPGAPHLCLRALRDYGTTTFSRIVGPTMALLAEGDKDWHGRLAETFAKMIEGESCRGGTRKENIDAACDRFYRGDIADDLVSWYREKGGFLTHEDLAAQDTAEEEPLFVDYHGYRICKCDTWTQGPVLCQALALLEGFDLAKAGHLSTNYVHTVVECLKLAFADRDEYYGDPAFVDVPIRELLSRNYTDLRRGLVDPLSASLARRPGDPLAMKAVKDNPCQDPTDQGGTTTCVVADKWGNVVAATPSCNVFGDKGHGGATGVTHGNRLRSLNSTPGHPNCIAPGKRPRITLTPTMVLKDNLPVLAVSVAGGDLQDQTTLNLLLNFVEFNMPVDSCVRQPRFATQGHEDSFNPAVDRTSAFVDAGKLVINAEAEAGVGKDLASLGHTVEAAKGAIAAPVMLHIDRKEGLFRAAGDPAAGRHADAF